MFQKPHSVLGVSFDGLAISGIVNEFLNIASVFNKNGLRVLFDPGYDITIGKTKDLGGASFPPWVEPTRCTGGTYPPDYCAELIDEASKIVVAGTSIAASSKIYKDVCRELAESFVATFAREKVRFIVVENGTIPSNPLFTEAIYLAIVEYGAKQNLGKYVLWRDHDLMWSAEPHLYGSYPYPGVRKPDANNYIHYAVLTEWMRSRMRAWAPAGTYHVIPNRFFSADSQQQPNRSIRAAYSIPEDAYLIARCTRVVPQKSIERDLRLLDRLQLRLAASGDRRKVFLFVTGPTGEDGIEFDRLRSLELGLSIAGQVVWGNGLLPFNATMTDPASQTSRFSVRDLLIQADLSSFLTTYDYEGFGNPPGEAMAMGVPFISTTYELYHDVYGSKGVVAPLLPISRSSRPEEPMPESFIDWTLRTLVDSAYRKQIVRRNLDVCRRHFSIDALNRQVSNIFGNI